MRPIARFPYLVFYVAGEDIVDVWRVLHTKRDIPPAIADDIEDYFEGPAGGEAICERPRPSAR